MVDDVIAGVWYVATSAASAVASAVTGLRSAGQGLADGQLQIVATETAMLTAWGLVRAVGTSMMVVRAAADHATAAAAAIEDFARERCNAAQAAHDESNRMHREAQRIASAGGIRAVAGPPATRALAGSSAASQEDQTDESDDEQCDRGWPSVPVGQPIAYHQRDEIPQAMAVFAVDHQDRLQEQLWASTAGSSASAPSVRRGLAVA